MSDEEKKFDVEDYAGGEVAELVGVPVPTFLKWVYLILPLWGLVWFWLYWDGSTGVLDRGSWEGLQRAANTTVQSRATSDPLPPNSPQKPVGSKGSTAPDYR